MAIPNIVSPTTINFKSTAVALVSGGGDILSNASASGFSYKIDIIHIANVHTSGTTVSLKLTKNGTSFTFFSGTLSGNAIFQFPGPTLEENDLISGSAVDDSRVNTLVTYQVIN